MLTIVDYGLGNVQAFLNVYRRMGVAARAATTPHELDGATRLILPGVGAFDHALERLSRSGLREPLTALVQERRVPVLGVCVGMQMLADGSEEGSASGLGWIPGYVRSLARPASDLPLPHMGWNDVATLASDPLFAGMEMGSRFYFLHSYRFECATPGHAIAACHYGDDFTAAVRAGHVCGVQFHPEKSHQFGRRLLQNFAGL